MASDYARIREENKERYGTDIGRIGPMLLSERYADRTHFIFELLQNAEDALARRANWRGSRAVKFHLANSTLRVSHYGEPFDENDVRAICGIALSTKELNTIGRFGIGFKSVYAFSDRPEIHSGTEDFAIENFVWPFAAPPVQRADDETVILLPLRVQDKQAFEEIRRGLQQIGPRTLLFLRHIDEIEWHVDGGPSGSYLRIPHGNLGDGVERITLMGEEGDKPTIEETWLVFSRQVTTDDGDTRGCVEIAFAIKRGDAHNRETIVRVQDSPLVVFFPTVLETHLGFLVQGPYCTTPSRDNVPRSNPWNEHLVKETATLLISALRWLRDHGLLDSAALRCLPLDSMKFSEKTMFAPLFVAVKRALMSEPLLPRFDGGYVEGSRARLARTLELRELFTPRQLAALFHQEGEVAWLGGDITQDRTPELRQYLMRELGISEIIPEMIVARLDREFLEAQPDEWILKLYEFLNGQPALRRRLDNIPIVRLANGRHVTAQLNGQPQAFLPGNAETDFQTVRPEVCATDESRSFLKSLGLNESRPVDDVIWNILPKYHGRNRADTNEAEYAADLCRILAAFDTDSKAEQNKLLESLRDTAFVKAIDAANGSKTLSKPGEVYLATERLKELLAGVRGVFFVDDSYACLQGERVRGLLEACGATRYLRPVAMQPTFTLQQLREMRVKAGCEDMSSIESLEDYTLCGLDGWLKLLPTLDNGSRARRSALLWEALGDLEERRGRGAFSGSYKWFFYHRRTASFDAAFVRQLNETAWVPSANGQLERPEFVSFDTLGWKPNPFLQSIIHFKPPVIETLAKEVGIEAGVLDLLKKLGVTTEAELRSKLGLPDAEPTQAAPGSGPQSVEEALNALLGTEAPAPTPPTSDISGKEPHWPGSARGGGISGEGGYGGDVGVSKSVVSGPDDGTTAGAGSRSWNGGARRTVGSPGGRPFISYVGVHPHDEVADPDGLDYAARTALEERAISLVLQSEPRLQRTPTNNPGFDLIEPGANGQPTRWVEVKAMTGSLRDRPVGLSQAQFDCAQKHGAAYWLYVVEHANGDRARIRRIRDPVGRARTFTFDRGWLRVAELDEEEQDMFGLGPLAAGAEEQADTQE